MESNKRLEESKAKEYVLGFCFNSDKSRILLIKKKKPDFQKGFLNGIGGAIEEGEIPEDAMHREFKEETGLDLLYWDLFGVMTCKFKSTAKLMKVWIYRIQVSNDIFAKAHTMEEEEVMMMFVGELNGYKLMNNLKTLIPMALDDNFRYSQLNLNYN